MDVGQNLWKFQVNQTNPFRDIAVGSWLKKRPDSAIALYDRFFQPTSDGNISETVGLINLKLSQIRAHIHGQNLWKFQVNQTNRFRDIAIGSWLKKTTI